MQFSDKLATAVGIPVTALVAKYTMVVAFMALSLAVTAIATSRVGVVMGLMGRPAMPSAVF